MPSFPSGWSPTTCDHTAPRSETLGSSAGMSAGNGRTIERRIRIDAAAGAQDAAVQESGFGAENFSPRTPRSTTPLTSNVISPRPKRVAAQLRRLMNVPNRAFERALGMSPAALAECAEAAIRILADLQATAPGQPQAVFNFILGPKSGGRPSGSQKRNSHL
jgi:hypothetical protein